MSLRRPAHQARALRQWESLRGALADAGARVRLLAPRATVPDLVFTANAGLVIPGRARAGTFIRSNFRFPERQREEPMVAAYFRRAGYQVVTLPRRFGFEGEGDALWFGRTLVVGFRFRSDAPVHEPLARLVRAEVLPVELADRRFYHLDTCFCPLDGTAALWYPRAFDRYGRKVLERLVPFPLAVSEADAVRFVCNAIVCGRTVLLHAGVSAALRRRLARRGFRAVSVDLSEFLKAGGSAKCLVLRLGARHGEDAR